MGFFTEIGGYPSQVNKYESTDPVQGGEETAPSNLPLRQLTTRTSWLKNAYDAFLAAYNAFTSTLGNTYYNKREVDIKFSNLVNGAPGILDTLSEIANALGNDSNLASTLTNAINNEVNARTTAVQQEANARWVKDEQIVNDVIGGLIFKTIPIGDWNMDATETLDISLAPYCTADKFRAILDVRIIDDSQIYYYPLSIHDGGQVYVSYDGNFIRLTRINAGIFDSVQHDSTGFNRGYVTFAYIE